MSGVKKNVRKGKNKYVKGSHLNEEEFRRILLLFCEDKTATEVAALSGINRNTINRLSVLFRKRMTLLAEKEAIRNAKRYGKTKQQRA